MGFYFKSSLGFGIGRELLLYSLGGFKTSSFYYLKSSTFYRSSKIIY